MDRAIAAISTNNIGNGAINIVRVSGPDAILIVSKIFSNSHFLNAPSHTIHYGFIKDHETMIDEVLVMLMRAPKTYTREDVVEINCHGGYVTTNKILELLLDNGAVLAEPGEFTKRAFLNGRINLLEAESVSDMINAKTESSRAMALNGLRGETTTLIESLREKMVSLLSNIEVNIDYPEYTDELVITKKNITPVLTDIKQSLESIINDSLNGKLIRNGIQIAIIGKPNVGKSSLLNALINENKAIVTDISGTTRDVVEGSIVYKDIEFDFFDTAGIRETNDIVEKIGVEKSKEIQKTSDITILVLNSNDVLTKEDEYLLSSIENQRSIIFINKNDLQNKIGDIHSPKKIIMGNTTTKEGLKELQEEILNEFSLTDMASKDLTYLSNTRQINLAKNALKDIDHVIAENAKNVPVDMLAIEIRGSWENLGKIIGESYENELVDNIFKRFCLGK